VSYLDDVFSPKPGTISAQYFFSRDLYLEGSSKTTLDRQQEPTMELHYTIRVLTVRAVRPVSTSRWPRKRWNLDVAALVSLE
jgi:hypothetical protein